MPAGSPGTYYSANDEVAVANQDNSDLNEAVVNVSNGTVQVESIDSADVQQQPGDETNDNFQANEEDENESDHQVGTGDDYQQVEIDENENINEQFFDQS